MGGGVEARFERYTDVMIGTLEHADRATPARWYLRGLILPGERKSVEPMAARVHPQDVASAHQSMHHLVADSEWSDAALLQAVTTEVLPVLTQSTAGPCYWIIDDTSFRKYGRCSVGVARQYCGQLGKTENCQVAVSLSFATAEGSLPLAYRLYLPREWTDEPTRCEQVGVPPSVAFATKHEIAWTQIEAALAAGIPHGTVLMDTGYENAILRDRLTAHGLQYAAGIHPQTMLWWGKHEPGPMPPKPRRGPQRKRAVRDAAHQPISALHIAQALPAEAYRTLTWREGTNAPLSSRFARVRARAVHGEVLRAEEWLLIEWPQGETRPTKYFLCTLSEGVSFERLVDTVKMRWRIERDYLELKQELGLSHYEGRNWRGFHHHASLCIAAYGFLMLERLSGFKKNTARLQAPALPEAFSPRGARPDAASHSVVHRNGALPSSARHRAKPSTMSVLR
jgi:SRSO17 transposase